MSWEMRRVAAVLATVALGAGIVACGSDDDEGGTTGQPATTQASGATTGSASTTASPSEEVVPGVPSLDALYKGTEQEPPTTGPAALKDKYVIWVNCGALSPGCVQPAQFGADVAKELGWRFKTIDGKLNPAGWAAGLRQAIAEKPDAIVMEGIDCGLVKQPLEEAKQAGVPVIATFAEDCPGDPLFAVEVQYNDTTPDIVAFNKMFGTYSAAAVIDTQDGKAKVVASKHTDALLPRWAGLEETMAKCTTCEMWPLEVPTADFVASGPIKQKMVQALQQHPDANAAIGLYDSTLALGQQAAWDQIARSGRDVYTVTGEGLDTSIDAMLKTGIPTAVVAYDLRWRAWMMMDIVNRLLAGEDQVPEGIGIRLVDKEHNAPADGGRYVSPIDYQSAYRKVWQIGS